MNVTTNVNVNMLTIDVEDWRQSVVDRRRAISPRVVTNTRRLLALLAAHDTRATFFVQSAVAAAFPELVRAIADGGHEIGSHGHTHRTVYELGREELRQELRTSREMLAQLIGTPVLGFRAPVFSIREETYWALEVIRAEGFRYSSSIFPFRGRRYGMPGVPLAPHEIIPGLLEVPLSVVRLAGRSWPVAGGGYLRLLPYALTRRAIQSINASGRAAVVYLHPYELDTEEVRLARGEVSRFFRWSQDAGRRHTEGKLRALLRDFRFAPVRDVLRLGAGRDEDGANTTAISPVGAGHRHEHDPAP